MFEIEFVILCPTVILGVVCPNADGPTLGYVHVLLIIVDVREVNPCGTSDSHIFFGSCVRGLRSGRLLVRVGDALVPASALGGGGIISVLWG